MGYTPYKMLGHEHPGIKQKNPSPNTMKAFGTKDTEFLDQENTDTGTSPTNYGAAVGSSPNKLGGSFGNIAAKVASKGRELMGGGGPTVPSHGDESHTGGAVGTGEPEAVDAVAPEEAPWEAMGKKEWGGMNMSGRMKHLKGLTPEQRKAQLKEGGGMFGGGVAGLFGGGGGFGSMFSDIRLKENIDRVGISPSGIPIYEFNYIGDDARYSGAMAQDLLGTDAVSIDASGFYMVDYNSIDIDMKTI